MSTLALTQCWYTRSHQPRQTPKDQVDGAFYAYCRYCRRPIFSIDGGMWHIDGGFNMETLGDVANSFLSVVDVVDGMILARIPIDPGADEAAVDAIKEQIKQDYGVGEDGNFLAIHDNRPGHRTRSPASRSKKRSPSTKSGGASAA
jgi:hypothetical protein